MAIGGTGAVMATVSAEKAVSGKDSCFRDSPGCRGRFLARVAYFTSKKGLDIAGLGRGRLKLLIEAGLVDDLPSIFRLSSAEPQLAAALGTKTAARVTAAIESRRYTHQFRTLTALGIAGVGPLAAQRLAIKFHTLDALLVADEQQVNDLPGCSGAAHLVRDFFSTADGRALLQDFRNDGFW